MITFQHVTTQSLHAFGLSVDKGQGVWISCDRKTAQDLIGLLTGRIHPAIGKMEVDGQSISDRKNIVNRLDIVLINGLDGIAGQLRGH